MKKITILTITFSLLLLTGCGKVNQETFLQDSQAIMENLSQLHDRLITEEEFRANFDAYTEEYSGKLSEAQQTIYINLREAYGTLMEANLSKIMGETGEAEYLIQEYLKHAEKVKTLLSYL